MIYTYLKIALRSIRRHRFFSIVNIFGLAISMSVCLLVIVMIADQKKFDRFHTQKDRIYRILSKREGNSLWGGTSPYPLKYELLNSYSGIEKETAFRMFLGGDLKYENQVVTQAGLYTDSTFFGIFDFPFVAGDPETALSQPYSMVLKKSVADKLFGNIDPVGKVISFKDRRIDVFDFGLEDKEKDLGDFTVTGVIGEEGYKSHIKFDFVVSMSTLQSLVQKEVYQVPFNDWDNCWEFYQYVLLEEGKSKDDLASILNNISKTKYTIADKKAIVFEAQPLADITPGKFINNPTSLQMPREGFYFLGFLALIVVLSACFNYTNLSVARALTRSKEVGLRKINGAQRHQIFSQFISEAVLISLVALVFSMVILQVLKSGFRNFWFNQYLDIRLDAGYGVLLIFIVFSILLGIIAGFIPALYLSSFNPLKVISRDFSRGSGIKGLFIFKKPFLGKSLVVAQFVFSLVLMITTIVLYRQLGHLVVAEYGFDRENLINVKLQGNDYHQLANEFSSSSNVIRVSASNIIPAMGVSMGATFVSQAHPEDSLYMNHFIVDQNYITNFGLTLVAGRNFPQEISDNTEQYVIINETACDKLGYGDPSHAIGDIIIARDNSEAVQIIGVLKDFHYDLFMDNIQPLVLRYDPKNFQYANVKVTGNNLQETVSFLENKWKKIDQVHVFNYKFFDEQLAKTNSIFRDVISIIGFIALLAITISSLGLLGMATFTSETRRKEIGIRKAMGASTNSVLILLSKGFIYLLIVAAAIAIPLSYYLNRIWLQEFAYRIKLGPSLFLGGILIILILGLFTIGSQTLKAALTNPSAILRDE